MGIQYFTNWFFKKPQRSDFEIIYEAIKKFPVSEQADMSCQLNHWAFPTQIAHLKPSYWVNGQIANETTQYKLLHSLRVAIDRAIGHYEVSKAHFKRLGKTHQEFEEYWETSIWNRNRRALTKEEQEFEDLALGVFFRAFKGKDKVTDADLKTAVIDEKMSKNNMLN